MPSNLTNINSQSFHSTEFDEIVNTSPGGVGIYGSMIICCVMVLLLVVSSIIKYPETIKGSCTLYTSPPKAIAAKVDGRLSELLVKDGYRVEEGQTLAILQPKTRHYEVSRLRSALNKLLKSYNQPNSEDIPLELEGFNNLGDLQSSFHEFAIAYQRYRSFSAEGVYVKKKQLLQQELRNNELLKKTLESQKAIYEKDIIIADSDYQVKSLLYKEKVIAKLELKQEESKLLMKKIPLENLATAITNNHSAAIYKQRELVELENMSTEIESSLLQSINQLLNAISLWDEKYVISAPISGTVSFIDMIEAGQLVSSGQEIMYIESLYNASYGLIELDQLNYGKILPGQTVLLRMPSFPAEEYGSVAGEVSFISRIANKNNKFIAKVKFPRGVITNLGFSITQANKLSGEAQIVTKKQRLITRLFHSILRLF